MTEEAFDYPKNWRLDFPLLKKYPNHTFLKKFGEGSEAHWIAVLVEDGVPRAVARSHDRERAAKLVVDFCNRCVN